MVVETSRDVIKIRSVSGRMVMVMVNGMGRNAWTIIITG